MPDIEPRRSVLYVPADKPRAIARARALPVDAVILDLEDSVSPECKADAREALRETMAAPFPCTVRPSGNMTAHDRRKGLRITV